MPAPSMVIGRFRELLARSGLVALSKIPSIGPEIASQDPTGGLQLARLMVRRGLLTRFQAERLLEGRSRGFFVDEFRVLELLGAGGMAFLYLAQDRSREGLRALKLVNDKFRSDRGILARLDAEFEAGRRIRHPHVVRTLASRVGEDVFGPVPYLVLEFLRGITLEELLLMQTRLPWRQACACVREAALGLQAAHDNGVIHRDVKPANLLIDAAGITRVIDFGLALVRDTGMEAEFSLAMLFGHDCLGTADFISPEQSLEGQRVDVRADIYSLGCTLYTLITGAVPFPVATNRHKLTAHRQDQFPDIRIHAPNLPDDVVGLLSGMVAKTPDKRPSSMAEVATTLEQFAQQPSVCFDYERILAHRAAVARRRFPRSPSSEKSDGTENQEGSP